MTANLFQFTKGPRDARIMLVGEAWGAEEELKRLPFVGEAGKELDRMLFDAGLQRNDILVTNIVHAKPPGNDFATGFTQSPAIAKGLQKVNGVIYTEKLFEGMETLYKLIDAVKPSLIIGCGNWPLWALTNHATLRTVRGYPTPGGILSWRGSQTYTKEIHGTTYRYLPVVHPAAILRAWYLRSTTVHDLRIRAGRFISGTLKWEEPKQDFYYGTEANAHIAYLDYWISTATNRELKLSVDVETYARQSLTCIGLADATTAICIPFFLFNADGSSRDIFTLNEETEIVARIKRLLTHPNVRIIGQNFIYDAQWLYQTFGIKVAPWVDTMLAHHLLFPGTPKALHTLASLYSTYYCYWKDESEDWADTDLDAQSLWRYNCKDVRYTYDIALDLDQALTKMNLWSLYRFQLAQWRSALNSMLFGINYDHTLRFKYKAQLEKDAASLESWLIEAVPPDSQYANSDKKTPWYRSPQLTMDILYRQLGLEPVLDKKTKSPTTAAEALEVLRKRTPWLAPLLDRLELLRSLYVFQSHFINIRFAQDGRFRTSFNIGGTETFRWSSSSNAFGEGTNLQNTPKIEE